MPTFQSDDPTVSAVDGKHSSSGTAVTGSSVRGMGMHGVTPGCHSRSGWTSLGQARRRATSFADGGVIKIVPGSTTQKWPGRAGKQFAVDAPLGNVVIGSG